MKPFRSAQDALSDDERFDAVYRDHYGRVLAYALRRATPAVAQDIVADTFLVAWRRLDRLPTEPLPWLLGIARKTVANHRRGARRREALIGQLRADGAVQLRSENDPPMLTAAELAAALARLPESDRELLLLIAWDGLCVGEAAAVIGVSAPTCRVRLHRARRRLSAELRRGRDVRTPREAGHFHRPAKEGQP